MVIQMGVIGAGRIGKIHAASIAQRTPGARLLAVSDIDAAAAQALGEALHVPHIDTSHRPMLDNPEIDAVAICSATDTHAPLIIEAARAGKHIFCEKPIASDLKQIDAALAAVEEAGVKLMIGFNRRFDPNFRAIRELVTAGKAGTPRVIRITSRDPAPPPVAYLKVSGGLFFDMTIHDFDMARYLVDSPVVEVYAVGGVLVDAAIGSEAGDIDTAVITLRYASGAFAIIENCRATAYGYDQRVEWSGSLGCLVAENNTPHRAILSDASGVHAAKPLHFFLERYLEAYVAEMQAFVQALATDTPPPVTGADGRAPVVIAMAAARSLREKRPVALSEIE